MSPLRTALLALGVIIIMGVILAVQPQKNTKRDSTTTPKEEASKGEHLSFLIRYDGSKEPEVEVFTAHEGDTITIAAFSTVAEEIHIHGYDKSIDLEPDVTKSIEFLAAKTGKFDIELEHSGIPVASLEVYPR